MEYKGDVPEGDLRDPKAEAVRRHSMTLFTYFDCRIVKISHNSPPHYVFRWGGAMRHLEEGLAP